jgi:2'-5' RNA ligase
MNSMYFIAHVLPPELDKDIHEFKLKMFELYGCRVGLKSPAHITFLPPFWMNEELEIALNNDLDAFAATVQPLLISANGFNCFKPKTIFVQPELSTELMKLKTSVDAFARSNPQYPAKPDERSFHPHITIATRDLRKMDFAHAWPLFRDKEFSAKWKADAVHVLRYNKKEWDVIHTSHFRL